MICYKDTAFCVTPGCRCARKLTPEVVKAAERWWINSGGKREETPIATGEFCDGSKEADTPNDIDALDGGVPAVET